MSLLALLLAASVDAGVERDVAVPMRDGVVLRADVLRPHGPGPFPVLVYRTPYGKHDAQRDYATFRRAVERGYAVVVQDVRGRYASEGEFDPYRQEGRDGYDTIEWAARQPWSSGAVGSFGLSYPGAVQWLAAVESPPHLVAMVPAMTFSTPRNFFHSGGVFDLSWIAWIWNNIAADTRVRKGLPGPRTDQEAEAEWELRRDVMRRFLPLGALPDLQGVAPYYFEWLSHPPGDGWWDWCELRGRYDRVRAAVLNLSGWHDEAYGPEGAITNYRGLRATRRGEADPRARLVLGPWVHGVGATRATRTGEREHGPAAAIDYDETVLRFMDRYLRGIQNGLEREKPVRVFVMGEGGWREADAWPVAGVEYRSLLLSAGGRLVDSPQAVRAGTARFVSDPAAPLTDPHAESRGAHDYRSLAERGDVAVFETAPLDKDLVVIGAIRAEVHVSVDAPDADLWVKLFDVAPDGTAFNLMSPGLDVAWASFQAGGPLRLGRVYALRFDQMYTGNRFARGHRLRVVLAPQFFPHFSRNLHTGLSEAVSASLRKAVVTVHYGPGRPSRLTLPVVP